MKKTILSTLLCAIVTFALAFTPAFTSFAAEDTYPLEIENDTLVSCNTNASGEVSINYPVTTIDARAFKDCNKITSILMPNTLSSIGEYAFQNCTELKAICIPENVGKIEKNTFENCKNLQVVYIPSSVTDIGDFAFKNCKSLQKVYYFGAEEDWDKVSIGSENDTLNDNIQFHPTHKFSDWETDENDENVKTRTCSECGYKEVEISNTNQDDNNDQNNNEILPVEEDNSDEDNNDQNNLEDEDNSDEDSTDQDNLEDEDNSDENSTDQDNLEDEDNSDQDDNAAITTNNDDSSPKTGDPIEDVQWYTQLLITASAILIITTIGRFLLD